MEKMLIILVVALIIYYWAYVTLSVRAAKHYINAMIYEIQRAHAVVEQNQLAIKVKNDSSDLG